MLYRKTFSNKALRSRGRPHEQQLLVSNCALLNHLLVHLPPRTTAHQGRAEGVFLKEIFSNIPPWFTIRKRQTQCGGPC